MRSIEVLRALELDTRPVRPESRAALARRWAELPEHVKTPAQLLGRCAIGCEGTHGVFPKCDLTCWPCYHSSDANHVAIDGPHTLAQIDRQMRYLHEQRGPRAHAQLIGGEVSLLPPDVHAAALQIMRSHGREPMSMTHGDFDDEYLRAVVLDESGRRRFERVSFAAHFDSLMRGRRGVPRPRSERELDRFRARFAQMFNDLQREHGVRSYLTHNMTVTPGNIAEVAETTRAVLGMRFDMLSFQPAAFVGDDRRWREDFSAVSIDQVWEQIETGAGRPLPWQGLQFGDPRCNRFALGLRLGGEFVPVIDPTDRRDLAARDRLLAHHGGMVFGAVPGARLGVKIARAALRHPGDVPVVLRHAMRIIRRAGGARRILTAVRAGQARMTSIVVHSFMDAAQVGPAWTLMQDGIRSDEPLLRETQERLSACMYTMSHPESGQLVPACVQHSVLDAGENALLRRTLPLMRTDAVAPPVSRMTPVRSTRPAARA